METNEFLGAGLSYRRELNDGIFSAPDRVDFLELLTDQYMDMPPHKEEEARFLGTQFPIVLHGVDLSIGTAGPIDKQYVEKMQQIAEWVKARWVSDHLCFTRTRDLNIGQLTPLVFNEEIASLTAANIAEVIRNFDCPFLVENISYYFTIPSSTLSEAEFITRVVRESGCWLLLDLANIQNNAINNHYDPFEFIDQIPLDRVIQIHLAGGYYHRGILLDTHSHPVPADVFDLLRYAVPQMPALRGVIIERDQNYPPFSDLLSELDETRSILETHWAPRHSGQRCDPRPEVERGSARALDAITI